MILLVNILLDEECRALFDKSFIKHFDIAGSEYEIVGFEELRQGLDSGNYTKLIVSGSEASVFDKNEWYVPLTNLIREFVNQRKPVLGICYGHQFLAYALHGRDVVRQREKPEIGWIKIQTEENRLFDGVKDPVCMFIHYDELFNLPEEFNIIAENGNAEVEAFQYKDLPVWGVQFHPEFGEEEAEILYKKTREKDPEAFIDFKDERGDDFSMEPNERIIQNFLAI